MELRSRKYRFPAAEGSRRQLLISLLGSNPIYAWIRAYDMRCSREARGEISECMLAKEMYERFVEFCKANDVEEKDIPTIQKFGRDMSDKYGFFKKRSQGGMTYQVYGAQMIDLKQELLINDVNNKLRGEEDIKQPESFIQPDD